MKSAYRRSVALFRNRHGVAAVEFAMVAPVLVLLALGIVDYGEMIWQKTAVDNAVAAGAAYAVSSCSGGAYTSACAAGISGAVYAATPLSIENLKQKESTGCLSASGDITVQASGTNCSDGYPARTYVQVNAQIPYNLLFAWPGFPASVTLEGQALARIGP